MKVTTLDQIVRRVLLTKRLPIHFYIEFMTHASTCLRELTMDTLQVINTVELTLDSYFAADLPCDFLDWVSVGTKQGQFLRPITQRNSITPLKNYAANGQPVPFGPPDTSTQAGVFWPIYWWYTNIDDLGENLGRYYGYNSAAGDPNGFKLIRERGQIQFTETFTRDTVVLQYISDGQCIDNATMIITYAQATIEAYINWKRSPNADIDRSPQGISYNNEWRKLRARMDDITIADIKQILIGAYKATPKE